MSKTGIVVETEKNIVKEINFGLVTDVKKYDIQCLAGLSTANGRDIFARIAAGMDLFLVSDAIKIDLAAKTAVKSNF